jgi:hypothetical protein
MPVAYIVSLNAIVKANVNQILDLLTGVMNDQPVTIANALLGRTVGATGQTSLGSPAASKFVGRWTTAGAPTGLTGAVGDYGIDSASTWWYCTAVGTPGSWLQMSPPPNTIAGNIKTLALVAAAGASGLSADASHIHDWSGLLAAALTWAAAQTWSALGTFNAGITVAGAVTLPAASIADAALSANIPKLNANNAFSGSNSFAALSAPISAPTYNGSAWAGTAQQLVVGFGGQSKQIMNATTRVDADAVEGDILVNA